MIAARVLAILSAALLVGAVAVATLGPQDMTLGQGLLALNRTGLLAAEAFIRAHLSAWVWDYPVTAMIARPVWLIPAALGLICAGGAMTAASGGNAAASRRRRS